jgi:pilus assembly protein CpaB
MILRRALLGLGAVALVTGIALSIVWLRFPPAEVVVEKPAVLAPAVLAAARALPAGTLLRADDLRWAQLSTGDTPPDSFLRGQAAETDVYGAATRRAFHSGEALVADQLIKPTDPGFLPAVLAPGMRATSIPVDAAEGGAGLITPGDRVDVILTQSFSDTGLSGSQRSVSETILPDLRIIAIDQTTHVPGMGRPGEIHPPVTAEPRLPKTVTLEVSRHQAEMLMVAGQLGKLQLTLRSLADATQPASSAADVPTWASEVSPALRSLGHRPAPLSGLEHAAGAVPMEIEIIRGSKGEHVCFAPETLSSTDCAGTSETALPGLPAAKPTEPHSEMPKS